MQAMLFFAIAVLMATLAYTGVASGIQTTRQLNQSLVEQTYNFMNMFKKSLQMNEAFLEMQVINRTSCDGRVYENKSIMPYLCNQDVRSLVTWTTREPARLDPWNMPFDGIVQTINVPFFAGHGNAIEVPITSVAIVSGGPDRQIAESTRIRLANYRSASNDISTYRNILALQSEATSPAGMDDIILTFTTQRQQEMRWRLISIALENVASAAIRQYELQFNRLRPEFKSFFVDNINQLVDSNSQVDINNDFLSLWRDQTNINRPQFNREIFENNQSGRELRALLGVDSDFDFIELSSDLKIEASNLSNQDNLVLTLSNNGSPWGGRTGNFQYSRIYNVN